MPTLRTESGAQEVPVEETERDVPPVELADRNVDDQLRRPEDECAQDGKSDENEEEDAEPFPEQ